MLSLTSKTGTTYSTSTSSHGVWSPRPERLRGGTCSRDSQCWQEYARTPVGAGWTGLPARGLGGTGWRPCWRACTHTMIGPLPHKNLYTHATWNCNQAQSIYSNYDSLIFNFGFIYLITLHTKYISVRINKEYMNYI